MKKNKLKWKPKMEKKKEGAGTIESFREMKSFSYKEESLRKIVEASVYKKSANLNVRLEEDKKEAASFKQTANARIYKSSAKINKMPNKYDAVDEVALCAVMQTAVLSLRHSFIIM